MTIMKMIPPLSLALLHLLSISVMAFDDEPVGFHHSIFDGKTLNGWTVENDCEIDVVDGCLRLKSGHGWLRHDSRLRDFDLNLEWKSLKPSQYDAGIYIRASSEGAKFPVSGYQIHLLEGQEGNISSLTGAESHGLVNPAGEWNRFEIHVEGDSAWLKVNGHPAWNATGLQARDGWIGFKVDVPSGGQFLFRNIEVVELGYKSLFNGRDFTGWVAMGGAIDDCWYTIDGILACTGKKGAWLRSVGEYDDFNLRLEYLASKSCNSGVFIRVPEDGKHHRDDETQPPAGIEIQVLDDTAPEHMDLKDFQYSASIYDFAGAVPHVCRPLGEWNSLEINCRDRQITTWHNGVFVANVTAEKKPSLLLRQTRGFLGLQNHGTAVQFRNLRLGSAVNFVVAE